MPCQLLSVIESLRHPNFTALYQRLGIEQEIATSIRKALKQVKKAPPDILVAEFIYGYGNNYAGVNISNLDVLLIALQRHQQETKVILFADKSEITHAPRLEDIHPLHAVLQLPVNPDEYKKTLEEIIPCQE
jgi:hypothetical protein